MAGYGRGRARWWRTRLRALAPVSDGEVVAVAASTAIGVWSGSVVVALIVGGAVSVAIRTPLWAACAVLLAVVGGVRSQQAWSELAPDRLGNFEGWVRVVDDPQPHPSSTRVIVEVEGERYETWLRGRAARLRVRSWRGGEWVLVQGERVELDEQRARRVAWQHIVGRFDVTWASDVEPGGPAARASNRVRAAIERAAAELPADDGALFRGLVIGDDRDQPTEMVQRFRASGLSHLTAVSGQNVAFVLAACAPLLTRMRAFGRWAVTLVVIAWFVMLTRFEPSILRAGVMAGLSATAFATGRERSPVRILAWAVIGLALVDPLLVWSVGFWLSVGATAGVCTVGPWLACRLTALGPLGLPMGITLGAQVGVVVPSVLVFGRLPLVSIPANLLAVPVAGLVMLYGLPAGLVAGCCPPLAPALMFPARIGTRWVDTVAALGAKVEPEPRVAWIGWGVIMLLVAIVVAADLCRGRAMTR